METKTKVFTSIWLDKKDLEKMTELAEKKKVSRSDLIRRAMRLYIKMLSKKEVQK